MFDVGFSELLLIGVVALVVLGPERLPRVARTAGHLLGRFQRYANQVKADINREMQLEELRKLEEKLKASAQEFESSVRSNVTAVESEVTAALDPKLAEPTTALPHAEIAEQVELSAAELAQAAHAADEAARAELAAIAHDLAHPTAPPSASPVAAEEPNPQLSLALEPEPPKPTQQI